MKKLTTAIAVILLATTAAAESKMHNLGYLYGVVIGCDLEVSEDTEATLAALFVSGDTEFAGGLVDATKDVNIATANNVKEAACVVMGVVVEQRGLK